MVKGRDREVKTGYLIETEGLMRKVMTYEDTLVTLEVPHNQQVRPDLTQVSSLFMFPREVRKSVSI